VSAETARLHVAPPKKINAQDQRILACTFSEAYMPTQPETATPRFITIAELVATSKVSRQTISNKLRSGEIPYTKLGSRVLIPTSFLMNLENAAWAKVKQEKAVCHA
jgi:excisionase family DNA binding protein